MSSEKWEKPELIVLVKGKSEEKVLDTCKTHSAGGGGPQTANYGCNTSSGSCDNCHDHATS